VLAHTLDKAVTRLDDAKADCTSAAGMRKAKSRVGQVKRALIQYVHRLGANSARKKLDPAAPANFQGRGRGDPARRDDAAEAARVPGRQRGVDVGAHGVRGAPAESAGASV
jgi:hypothetical protein